MNREEFLAQVSSLDFDKKAIANEQEILRKLQFDFPQLTKQETEVLLRRNFDQDQFFTVKLCDNLHELTTTNKASTNNPQLSEFAARVFLIWLEQLLADSSKLTHKLRNYIFKQGCKYDVEEDGETVPQGGQEEVEIYAAEQDPDDMLYEGEIVVNNPPFREKAEESTNHSTSSVSIEAKLVSIVEKTIYAMFKQLSIETWDSLQLTKCILSLVDHFKNSNAFHFDIETRESIILQYLSILRERIIHLPDTNRAIIPLLIDFFIKKDEGRHLKKSNPIKYKGIDFVCLILSDLGNSKDLLQFNETQLELRDHIKAVLTQVEDRISELHAMLKSNGSTDFEQHFFILEVLLRSCNIFIRSYRQDDGYSSEAIQTIFETNIFRTSLQFFLMPFADKRLPDSIKALQKESLTLLVHCALFNKQVSCYLNRVPSLGKLLRVDATNNQSALQIVFPAETIVLMLAIDIHGSQKKYSSHFFNSLELLLDTDSSNQASVHDALVCIDIMGKALAIVQSWSDFPKLREVINRFYSNLPNFFPKKESNEDGKYQESSPLYHELRRSTKKLLQQKNSKLD